MPKTIKRSANPPLRGALRWRLRFLAAVGVTSALAANAASALSLDIRPIDFGGGLTATGTIITDGDSANITDWRLSVSSFERLAHYTSANTPLRVISDVSVSGDGQAMSVATSPDGVADGGALGFRARNPSMNWGVSLADFSSNAAPGGEAFYVAGAAFDFLPLDQSAGMSYLAATASPSAGNVFDLVPLSFSGGVTLYGTILTSGRSGPLGPDDVLAWDIFVDMVTTDVFDSSNSRLAATHGDEPGRLPDLRQGHSRRTPLRAAARGLHRHARGPGRLLPGQDRRDHGRPRRRTRSLGGDR